jgi:hypothetical protein
VRVVSPQYLLSFRVGDPVYVKGGKCPDQRGRAEWGYAYVTRLNADDIEAEVKPRLCGVDLLPLESLLRAPQ